MMKELKPFLISLIIIALGYATIAFAAPYYIQERSLLPVDSTENIGTSTSRWAEGWFSSLNVSGTCTGCGSGTFSWTPTSWGVSTSTTIGLLQGFLSTASSTIDSNLRITGNLLINGNSTTTNATTTNFFSTTASSTNLFSSLLTVGGNGLIVDSNRSVGIGSTSPWGLLSVNPNGISGPSFAIGSSNKTDFIVTNGGNVGIGTTSPSKLFSVQGDGIFQNSLTVENKITADSLSLRGFIFAAGASGVSTPTLASVQAILIGEAGVIADGGAGAQADYCLNCYYNAGWKYRNTATAIDILMYQGKTTFQRAVSGTAGSAITWLESMVIGSDGNVGIGTTSPYAKLSVVGETVAANFTATTTSNNTFPNLISTNSTTTNATTTNFFSTTASSTNLFSSVFNFGSSLFTLVSNTFTGSGIWDLGGATSFEIPNGASPTVDASGEIAVDTTSGQFKWYDSRKVRVITATSSSAFNIASTTLDALGGQFSTGTTTQLLKNWPMAVTLTGWYCKATSTGTVLVRFGDGTNWTNAASCSTTGAFNAATSNNTFTTFEDFQVQIGTSASSPSQVTITTDVEITAD